MNKFWGLLASAGLVSVPTIALAAPTLSDVLGASEITAAGYVSGSYEAGFNKGQTIYGHTFDTDANSFELNQAALTLSYTPTDGFGGLVNVIGGSDASVINGSYGSGGADIALTQAYVQWAHGPFTVIAGRFVTLAGEEVIDDSKNLDVSRSLLFTLAEPLVHTGVRGSFKVSDTLTTYLGVSNSALGGDTLDGDKHKTVEASAAYTPTSTISLALTDYYGVDGSTKDNYLDAVANFQATPALLVAVNADYARFVGPDPSSTYIYGAAGYVSYQITDSWKASLRGEILEEGATGGDSHTLTELTLTGDYSATKSFDILGEIRSDYAGQKVYPDGTTEVPDGAGGFTTVDKGTKTQPEVLIKAIWKFGTPAPAAS